MTLRRIVLALAVSVVAASALTAEPVIAATPCSQDAKARLTVIDAQTVNKAAFKPAFRPKSTRDLDLVFKVEGCTLVNADPTPTMVPRPIKGQEKLPQGAIGEVTADVGDGSTLSLTVPLSRSDLDPGDYGGALEARASYLASNATPITVTRTDEIYWPPIVGALGGLIGLVWFGLLKFVGRGQLQIGRRWLAVLPVLAAAVGAWQGLSAYWDQELWVLDQNWKGTGVAAASAASAGALGAVLATVWKTPPQEEGGEEEAGELGERAEPHPPPA